LLKKGKFVGATSVVVSHIWNTRTLPVLGLGIRSRIWSLLGRGRKGEQFPKWIQPDFEKRLNLRERFQELQRKPASAHPIHPLAYAMLMGPFWPNVLEGEDAAWSGVALEVRAPLLDRRLVRFLLRLPALPWCMDKRLVRRAMKGELPKETLQRPKTPMMQDPLELHVAEKKWSAPHFGENAFIKSMMDVERLESCLKANSEHALYENLRPLSLELWLKSVEMKRGIQ
jgi:asparagine synthase (glutamine-hydrolysing)